MVVIASIEAKKLVIPDLIRDPLTFAKMIRLAIHIG